MSPDCWEERLLEGGTALLLLGVPLVFSTHLADAVLAPKLALFQVGAAAVITAWLLGEARGLWPRRRTPALIQAALLLYAWWGLRGLIEGLPPRAALPTLVAGILGLLAVAWWRTMDSRRARRWLLYPAAAGVVAATYSHLQRARMDWVPWSHPHLSQERTIATFGNPDYLAAYLVMALFVGLSLACEAPRRGVRGAALTGCVWGAAAMALTMTRAAWVAGAAGTALLLGAAARRRPELGRAALTLGVLLLALAGLGVAQRDRDSEFTLGARLRSFTDFRDLSFRTRIFLWTAALRMVKERPLSGVGPGAYPLKALSHRDLEPPETRLLMRIPENPHNQYLTVLVETGVPGGILLLGTLTLFFRSLHKRLPEGLPVAGVLAAGAAHWVNDFFVTSTLSTRVLWVLLLAWAAAPPGKTARLTPRPPSRAGRALACLALLLVGVASGRQVGAEAWMWRGDDHLYRARRHLQERGGGSRERALGSYREAIRELLKAQRWAPPWRKKEAYRRLGEAFEELYRRVGAHPPWAEGALTAYRAIAVLEPDDPYPHAWQADILEVSGRPREALEARRQALRLDPYNPVFHAQLGALLAHEGRWEESLQAFEHSLSIAPHLARAHLDRGRVLCRLGREAEALEAFAEAIRRDPGLEEEVEAARRACRTPRTGSPPPLGEGQACSRR